jgi:hypothetical protein
LVLLFILHTETQQLQREELLPSGVRPANKIIPPRFLLWVDNIKMDLREIGWDGMDWIDLTQDKEQWRALVNTVMNLRVP